MKNLAAILMMSLLLGICNFISATDMSNLDDSVVKQRPAREAVDDAPYTKADKDALLKAHNDYRAEAGASGMKELEWLPELEKAAQVWADGCRFDHPTPEQQKVAIRQIKGWPSLGQNLAVSSTLKRKNNVTWPIIEWYKGEIDDYTYDTMKCAPQKMCGHYTQVVWANTAYVGCAVKYCDVVTMDGSPMIPQIKYLVVCEYGPPGNYRGQHPFQKGKACSKCPADKKNCINKLCSSRSEAGDEKNNDSAPKDSKDNKDSKDSKDNKASSVGSEIGILMAGIFSAMLFY